MAITRKRSLLSAVLCAVLALGIAAPMLQAAGGDVLVEFKSELQTLPREQGWTHEGYCLLESCPGTHSDPDPPTHPCYYQGWWDGNTDLESDNNCKRGTGCRKSSQAGSPGEHYNSPLNPAWVGTCTYTEWIAFDDGNNQGDRPLTILDSTVSGSPPWGAPSFNHAPSYPVLRIVTGDGNLDTGTDSLPISGAENHRNQGRAEVYRSFAVPGGVTAVTLVCRAAAGPRSAMREIVSVRAFGRRFSFGVDGDPSSPNYGRFTYGQDASGNILGTIFTESVSIAEPNGLSSPAEGGEFFTIRAFLRADGTVLAYLNEEVGSAATGQVPSGYPGDPMINLVPDTDDATVWIDYVKIQEREVPPPPPPPSCPDPVFNIDGGSGDTDIDQTDIDAFFGCATGPANANGTWANLNHPCQCMDVDHDQSIDMNDFAVLQRCITTGGGGLVPTCDD